MIKDSHYFAEMNVKVNRRSNKGVFRLKDHYCLLELTI